MFFKTPSTTRFQLTCLVVASVLPVWLVSGFLVFHAYSAKRDQVNRTMLETARSLTMVVDRELTSVQAALLALATSPTFATGDLGSVHRQALQLLKLYPGADIIVADVTGQQLVNSARPYGSPLPRRNNPETVRRIFETGKPVISDLYFGALSKRPLIGIDVPVICDGKVAYDLAMTFPSDLMVSLLLQRRLPPNWYASILDSKKIVVAHSRDAKRYVGSGVTPDFRRALALASEGTAEVINLEGKPVFATFCRSAMSGWSVALGVSKASVMAEIYRWVGWAIAGAAGISLFGIALAMCFARRIAKAIHLLVGPAQAIGRGEVTAAVGTHVVKETGEVASALFRASELLQARAKERDHALRELERSNKELEQFAYVASHDLQEPLRMVSSYTQLLAERYEDQLDDKARKFIDYAVDGAVRMQRLINDLLAYSRLNTQGKTIDTVDSNAVLDDALRNLTAAIEENRAIVIKDDLPKVVRADATQLNQLFQNLIGNAIKFRGADLPRVHISAFDLDGEWCFSVQDNGIGIEAQYAQKVFAIFQRLHTRQEYPGTGIGLAICNRIVERHGGKMWFESEPGLGSTFHFTLPKEKETPNG